MRFPPSLLDDIRARLPVSVVVGRRVKLVKSGREWKGLSPFQQERTPSFYVNDQKGFYHCFSSGKHGDIFRFVTETEGLSFPEAVERLAAEAGVTLPKVAPEAAAQEQKRKDLYDVVELAAKFFEAQLQKPAGSAARAYLAKRGLTERTQAEFRMGFAPEGREALLQHLRTHGVTDRQMLDAGLVIEPEDRSRALYDRFRNRVIIPIQDMKGRVVAFGGRVLDPDAKPKYLNSPETPLFTKGHIVFNGHRAREAAFKTGSVIATEGYLDAIAVWQAGLRHVVATLGTAFTEEQIATLWRFASEPIVCFDGDKAGVAAANRAIDRILPALKTGFSFRFALLPEGQDPDDLIRNRGLDAFVEATAKAMPLWDALWQRETAHVDVSTPDRQAMLEKAIKDFVGQIADPLVRRRYELSAKFRLNQFFWEKTGGARRAAASGQNRRTPFGRDGVRTGPRETIRLSPGGAALEGAAPKHIAVERIFLGLCIHFPDLAERHRERIAGLKLRGALASDHYGATPHDAFLGDALRLIDETGAGGGEADGRTAFESLTEPAFMDGLETIHGREDERRGLAWGHRLMGAFPVLKAAPDPAFVERCFDHFISALELREAEDELDKLTATPIEHLTDEGAERLFQLRREIDIERVKLDTFEQQLAETAAKAIASAGAAIAPPRLRLPEPEEAMPAF